MHVIQLLLIYTADLTNNVDLIANMLDNQKINLFKFGDTWRPLMLICETVNICNNDCIICPYSSQSRKKELMNLDLFRNILDQYAEIGGGYISLTPMVGEVFLDSLLEKKA